MIKIFFIIVVLFSIIGCSGDASKYEEAKINGSVASYQEYLTKYPEGKFAQDARDAIETLVWDKIADLDGLENIAAFEEYLKEYPNGRYVQPAMGKIEEIEWGQIDAEPASESIDPYKNYLLKYPTGKYYEMARQKIESAADIIEIVADENSICFKGHGKVYADDKTIPLIVYSTDENGSLMGFGYLMCPFVQLNPAILDMTNYQESILTAIQEGDSGITHDVRIDPLKSDKLFIDSQYVVLPLGVANPDSKMAGPGVTLRLFSGEDDMNEIQWGDLEIEVTDDTETNLPVTQLKNGSLAVETIKREKLHVSITSKTSGKTWTYQLFPSFRSYYEGMVVYRVYNVSI